MNIRIRYIIAAVTAIVALFSCAKEPVLPAEEGGTVPQEGVRVISVSFGTPTKSTMGSDFKPEFKDGDWIKVSNTTAWEDCQVRVSGGKATIETTLAGELKAVYPREAALTDATTGIITGDGFTIKGTQSGKFSEANICMATIGASASKAVFYNKTAILRFYVDASIGVNRISIYSSNPIYGTSGHYVYVDPGSGSIPIHTVTEGPDTRICYVSILPGNNTLDFTVSTSSQGTVTKKMNSPVTFEANGIYNAFIPYYIKVKVSDTPEVYQYWGYCNLGAFLPEETGEYISWGELQGYKWTGTDFGGHSFTTEGHRLYQAGTWLRYHHGDSKTELMRIDDAPFQRWNEGWLIPTPEEFQTLRDATSTTAANFDAEKKLLSVNGYPTLIFPAGGYGQSSELKESDKGFYLTNQLKSSSENYSIQDFEFGTGVLKTNNNTRQFGLLLRPIFISGHNSVFDRYNDGGFI